MDKSKFVYVTYIRSSSDELWRALTTADVIKRYWFGMSVESSWVPGSTWKMYSDDRLMDSGEILECIPRKRLVIRWTNEWKPELKAEGDSRCVYEVESVGTSVRLTLTHSVERANSQFIEAVSEGWPMILSNLKSLLEVGEIALGEHPGHEES